MRKHTVKVTIPAGITDGQQLRLAGQGEHSSERRRARATCSWKCTSGRTGKFQLDGRDVTVTLPRRAVGSGARRHGTVPTLGGSVEMRIPAGAQSGQKLRLRGRGLPGNPPGDQFVQLESGAAAGGYAGGEGALRADAARAGVRRAGAGRR